MGKQDIPWQVHSSSRRTVHGTWSLILVNKFPGDEEFLRFLGLSRCSTNRRTDRSPEASELLVKPARSAHSCTKTSHRSWRAPRHLRSSRFVEFRTSVRNFVRKTKMTLRTATESGKGVLMCYTRRVRRRKRLVEQERLACGFSEDRKITRFMFGSRQTSNCHGIAAWRYYPWVNWFNTADSGLLRSVTYKKQRNDTILRVTFHSTLAQWYNGGCSQWYIQFGGQDCTQPAPITTSIYTDHNDGSHSNNRAPAEVSGFCNATSSGKLSPGNIQVSLHVKKCQSVSRGDAVTGTNFGQWTSYLLVEEYCAMWWLGLFSMSSISIWTKSFFLFFLILKCYSGCLILSLSSSVWTFPAFSSFLGDAFWAVEHYRNQINRQIQVIKSMSTLHLLKICAQRLIFLELISRA